MAKYQEKTVKLINTQLNKLKSAAKNETGTILRLNKEIFQDEELPNELFLARKGTTKIRNFFTNNMWTDENLVKFKYLK